MDKVPAVCSSVLSGIKNTIGRSSLLHCHSTFGGIESFSCLDDLGDDDILQWPDLSLDVVCDHLVDIADGLPELGMVVVLDGVVCSEWQMVYLLRDLAISTQRFPILLCRSINNFSS